jgi:hypothetical protein
MFRPRDRLLWAGISVDLLGSSNLDLDTPWRLSSLLHAPAVQLVARRYTD